MIFVRSVSNLDLDLTGEKKKKKKKKVEEEVEVKHLMMFLQLLIERVLFVEKSIEVLKNEFFSFVMPNQSDSIDSTNKTEDDEDENSFESND